MKKLWAAFAFGVISALQNVRRNFAISMAGVLTMALVLFIVGLIFVGDNVLNHDVAQAEAKADALKIYLDSGASAKSIVNYETLLRRDSRIKDVTFENKDAAEAEFAQSESSIQDAINILGSNPLPASLNLDVYKLDYVGQISNLSAGRPLVDTKTPSNLNQAAEQTFKTIETAVSWVGIVLSVILGFVSLVIIMNTIRTAVFVRRTEIEIMNLVGATNWFVRWPFLLEGMLLGLVAAIPAGGIVWLLYAFGPKGLDIVIHGVIPYLQFDSTVMGVAALILAGAGVAIGAFGSYLGVRRHLAI